MAAGGRRVRMPIRFGGNLTVSRPARGRRDGPLRQMAGEGPFCKKIPRKTKETLPANTPIFGGGEGVAGGQGGGSLP
jgi:hypothetical protein